MPVVGVNRDNLFAALGRTYTDEEFEELCFEYGIELDDVTSEREIRRKETQNAGNKQPDLDDISDEVIYKIDIPANRYDMLCLEGISRALTIFQGKTQLPNFRLADMTGKQMHRITIKPETAVIRPFVVCAILRGVTLDQSRYESFIDLQDKLHQNLCRQRTLVAIGTHDLSSIQGPFTYEALPPEDISFTPLKQTKEFTNAKDLLDHYLANDQKLKRYVPIIHSSLVYPVIYDANRTVLSLPPIINGAHSAITLDTKDIFIECTATDITKAKIVLNTVCAMFSCYCSTPFEIEPVEVVDSFGEMCVYPDVSARTMEVSMDYINSCTGLSLDAKDAAELLTKMQLRALCTTDGVSVEVPITRSDVLHACDVMEDVAIAYGYNNLPRRMPSTNCIGQELPLNQLCELLRTECAMAGFSEILTWALCSRHEVFKDLRLEDDDSAVSIGNPATAEFEVCRTTLLSGALKTLGANKDASLPIKLFEVSDVIHLSEEADVGATNRRRLVAVICSGSSSFESIHGLLNRVMEVLHVPYVQDESSSAVKMKEKYGGGYEWKKEESPTFFPGMHAAVYAKGQRVGGFGIVHPEVLAAFDLAYPVSALELELEPLCFDQFYNQLPTQAAMMAGR